MADEEAAGYDIPLKRAILILVVIFVLACIPIWIVKYPPLVDYPMHVARAYLLSLPQDGQGITEFYQAKWQPIPNLGMDIIVSQIMHFMPPLVAGKVFLCLIQLGLLSGSFAFAVALHKRITIAAFLPALALYDQWFFMGFANYLFGIGIAFWAVAVWLWSEDWPKSKRWAAMAGFAVVLVVCHMMALLVAVGTIFVLSLRDGPKLKATTRVLVGSATVCVLAYIGLLVIGRIPIQWDARIETLKNTMGISVFGVTALMTGGTMLAKRPQRDLALLLGLLVFTIFGPSFIGGTAFACDRLSLPLLFVWFATAVTRDKELRNALLVLSAISMSLWVSKAHYWNLHSDLASRNISLVVGMPPRSTLATFDLGLRHQETWKYQRHIPDWILLDKPIFVAQNFAKVRQQPMVFRPEFEDWHKYQNNNPVELNSWAEFVEELPKMQSLQADLNRKYRETGRQEAPLYALIFHKKEFADPPTDPRLTVILNDPEFTLLRVESRESKQTHK